MSHRYRSLGKMQLTEAAATSAPYVPDRVQAVTLTFKTNTGTPTITVKVSNDPEAAVGDAQTLATGVPTNAPYTLIANTARYAKYWFVGASMTGVTLDIYICAAVPF